MDWCGELKRYADATGYIVEYEQALEVGPRHSATFKVWVIAHSDDGLSLRAKGCGKRKKTAKTQAARALLFRMMPLHRVGLENTVRCKAGQEKEKAEKETNKEVDVMKEQVEDSNKTGEAEVDEDAKEDLIQGGSCEKGRRSYRIRLSSLGFHQPTPFSSGVRHGYASDLKDDLKSSLLEWTLEQHGTSCLAIAVQHTLYYHVEAMEYKMMISHTVMDNDTTLDIFKL
ncbi:uncharacterized protein LOC121651014 [Melanotaenia boesemani]|uniref:uncharacterized protein LOC121651014 n=1 Tax=Melanotaenia boesemani TaxID=1250792 RepID=UPI001C0479BC|nr:uncharacterized protein LOC121651014 [Melanotaenia boesemani]